MIFLFYTFLTLNAGYCTEEFKFEVKIVSVGENVTLTCPLQTSTLYQDSLYWIRLTSGNWPEFLGATFNFEFDSVSKIPHIQTKQEPGEFLLHINEAQQNDTGLYYCIKVRSLDFIFMNGSFLQIKGQESDVPVVVQKPPSDPAHSENPETLQCSVLSGSDRETCPVDNRVYWFKAGSDHSHPSLLYLQGSSRDECEKSPEVPSTQKCFYNFSETSDDRTYYCAVAACGQILFGNGAKPKGAKVQDFYKLFIAPLCSALVISLLVISCLIYKIKKRTCGCCNDPVSSIGNNQNHQREENALVYSAPAFNRNKAKKGERRNVKTAPEETVYTDVKTFR
ncbi:uncharacterized protein LOC118557507 [Fundulus heteroclitus]|uniref:uncharacterized protein LOC118557507 n=1 Tax=Fundulus heteroclitus TaxID=8078 RepID=UPI00165AFC5D|nr:uncharacterized protein LOC118557507 [Fundulus heteroclitus]